MNKKNIYSLFLIMFFMLATVSFVVADTSYFDFTASVEFPKFREAKVEHTAVNTVSKELEILNLKSSVNFGDYISATAELLYYFNDEVNISTITKGKILHKSNFYMTLSDLAGYDSVSYQIKVTLKKADSDEDFYAYWPSSNTFNKSMIVDSTSTAVTVSEGGTVEFESGNQEYGNTKVVIPGDSLSGDTTVIIRQLPLSMVGMSSAYMAAPANNLNNQAIALYSIITDPIVEIIKPITVELYYGAETEIKKFDLKYRADELSAWENVKILKTDTVKRIITANITKFGQYGIFVSSNLNDNDYRPQKRVKVKSRIESGKYSGFEFNYLQEGDVVKIYNVNGRKIAELKSITNGTAYWNGRKDTDNSGDWAESGTYIYQIKLKDKGKVISGTIAFVW